MKKLIVLITIFLASMGNLNAQYPDTIKIKLEKKVGFGPFNANLSFINQMDSNNPWITTVPQYKGVPDELEHQIFDAVSTDFMQHTYQSYKAGQISEERFQELKKAYNLIENEYSSDFVKTHIGVIAGYDKDGELLIKIDKNNNYDFSDDEYFVLPEKLPGQNFWGRYNDKLPFEVEYEFYDGKKRNAKTWMYVDYSPMQYNQNIEKVTPIELSYAHAEHHAGEFTINGIKYFAAVKCVRAVFRNYADIKVWTDETKGKAFSRLGESIKLNGHVLIGDYYYKFAKVKINGSEATLVKDQSVATRGGNEVGMKAINFTATTISRETIELEKLKGKFVLLDFWGTWCGPCRGEIPKLKEVYEKFKDKDFIILGIAKDNKESLEKFIKENEVMWPQILQNNDQSVISTYNVTSYPTTFLIDKEGMIIEKRIRANELEEKLKAVLGK